MKRTLAVLTSAVMALSIAPLASVASAAAPATSGNVVFPASGYGRDTRVARTCGDFCIESQYPDADYGAWFIDERDQLLLAESDGFHTVSTFSLKTMFRYDTPAGLGISNIASSARGDYVVVALTNGVIYQFDTYDWSSEVINDGQALSNIYRVAVSTNGEDVYVARNENAGFSPSTVERFRRGVLAETFTSEGTDYGIYELVLDDLDANLYIGWNGQSPTFAKLDAADISAGVTASDDSDVAWSASSIAVAADGTVFGGNPDISSAGLDGVEYPHVLKMNSTTLAVTDTIDTTQDWRSWELALSDNDDVLYVASKFIDATPGDAAEANKIDIVNPTNLEIEDTIVFDDLADASIENIDVDPSGRYLVASMDGQAYVVSLDDAPVTLTAEVFTLGDPDGMQAVDWNYIYLKPKAKFRWFEVKYVPAGKRKATVKRVKRATEKMIGATREGTGIRVRAVYTKKRFNSAWATAEIVTP